MTNKILTILQTISEVFIAVLVIIVLPVICLGAIVYGWLFDREEDC